MTFLTTILFILTLSFGIEKSNITQKLNELVSANAKITTENNDLAQKLQQSNELTQKLQQNNQLTQKSQENDNSQKAAIQKDKTTDSIVKMKAYTIQNGDTLNEICNNNNIDYSKNKSIILKMNGITNEDKIYSGQRLYLPLN